MLMVERDGDALISNLRQHLDGRFQTMMRETVGVVA
jgi:hypothetical protein